MVLVVSPDGEGGEPRAMYTRRFGLGSELCRAKHSLQIVPRR
jgi:hypothetical protein